MGTNNDGPKGSGFPRAFAVSLPDEVDSGALKPIEAALLAGLAAAVAVLGDTRDQLDRIAEIMEAFACADNRVRPALNMLRARRAYIGAEAGSERELEGAEELVAALREMKEAGLSMPDGMMEEADGVLSDLRRRASAAGAAERRRKND